MQVAPAWSAAIGATAWLATGFAAGLGTVAYLGDYGSVLHLLTGAVIGAFGAAAHISVCLVPGLRTLGVLQRALLTWLLAYVPCFALAMVLLDPAKAYHANTIDWGQLFMMFVPYTGLPMLALAILIAAVFSAPKSPAR